MADCVPHGSKKSSSSSVSSPGLRHVTLHQSIFFSLHSHVSSFTIHAPFTHLAFTAPCPPAYIIIIVETMLGLRQEASRNVATYLKAGTRPISCSTTWKRSVPTSTLNNV